MHIVNNVVDRQHVSASNVDIIRAIRRAFRRPNMIHKRVRKQMYRHAIKRHASNRDLFYRVTRGLI